jgi:beta-glucanase (GH16 family)
MRFQLSCALLAAVAGSVLTFQSVASAGLLGSKPCGAKIYKSDGTLWACTFDDEFSGTRLDAAKWSPITTAQNGITAGAGAGCFVDSRNNIAVSSGKLRLVVRRETTPFTCQSPRGNFSTQYSAGQVATYGKFAQQYGRFAVKARFPAATVAGLQESLWMWPANVSNVSGEIDIAEHYSATSDRVIPYLHYNYDPSTVNASTNTNIVTNNWCMVTKVNAFHEYTLEWNASTITIYIDGSVCLIDNYVSSGTPPFAQPFFIILSAGLGVGKNAFDPATTPLPATTMIDYVRVWK